jgi:hypothetical protein
LKLGARPDVPKAGAKTDLRNVVMITLPQHLRALHTLYRFGPWSKDDYLGSAALLRAASCDGPVSRRRPTGATPTSSVALSWNVTFSRCPQYAKNNIQ